MTANLKRPDASNIWPYFYGIGGIGETITIAEIQRLILSDIFGFFKMIIHNANIRIETMIIILNRITFELNQYAIYFV